MAGMKRKKPRGSMLDKAMAGLLALAVGFVVIVVPADLLPLAGVARPALAAAGALVTFVLVSALLSALNRPRKRKPVQVPNDPPRLRRADAHPDAPSRSPILAGRELGVPLDEVAVDERPAADLAEVENVDFEAEWERPLPDFIPEQALSAEPEPAEWEPVEEARTVEPEPANIPFWVPDGTPAPPVREAIANPEPVEPEPPLPVPFPKPRGRARSGESLQAVAAPLPEPSWDAPVEEMVERLEGGLARRPRQAGSDLDQRLRGALGELKKMAGQ
jgi:hypothetical protein